MEKSSSTLTKLSKSSKPYKLHKTEQNAIKTALELYNGFHKLWRATYPEKNLSQRT